MNKITVCHATGSESNPFVSVTVSKNAVLNGHGGHAGDIIPPFDGFEGQNWTATGQDIYNNVCKVPVAPVDPSDPEPEEPEEPEEPVVPDPETPVEPEEPVVPVPENPEPEVPAEPPVDPEPEVPWTGNHDAEPPTCEPGFEGQWVLDGQWVCNPADLAVPGGEPQEVVGVGETVSVGRERPDELAQTGFDALGLVVGLAAIVVGAGAMVAGRFRRGNVEA